MDDAELTKEEQEHYVNEQEFLDLDELGLYGEEFNEKFIAELMKVKAEKGADYFRNYPSKSMMMGDDLKPLADAVGLAHKPNVQGNPVRYLTMTRESIMADKELQSIMEAFYNAAPYGNPEQQESEDKESVI